MPLLSICVRKVLHRLRIGAISKVCCVSASVSLLLLSGCAVEVENRQAALQLERESKLPGSVYTGWRVFQNNCAGCHGALATGTAGAPDLLPRVREMGSRQFVSVVLQRYSWGLPVDQAKAEGNAREILIDDILQRKEQYMLTMPAWAGEPVVSAQILDLFAYLLARADGSQGPGRPAQ
jgi:hypothetical protein